MGGSMQPASRQTGGALRPLWPLVALLGCLLSACSNSPPAGTPAAHIARHVSGPVLRTVRLTQRPFVMVADAPAGRIFVLSTNDPSAPDYNLPVASIQVLDATTGALVRTMPVSDYVPFVTTMGTTTLTVDPRGGQVFLASTQHVNGGGRGALHVLDGRTGHVVRTVALPYVPCALALDASAGHLFVGLSSGSTAAIAMLDDRTGALLRSVSAKGAPCLPSVDAHEHAVFFGSVDPALQQLTTLNARTGAARAPMAVTADGFIDALAVDERAGRVLVDQFDGQGRRGNLSVFDARTGRPIAEVDGVGGEPLVVDATTGHAFAVKSAISTNNADNVVVNTVATRTGRLVRRVELIPAAENGSGAALAVDATRGRVYAVPAHDYARLIVLDARSGRRLRTIALGGAIDTPAVAVDERTGRIFVANAGAGTATVLDAARL